MDSCESGGLLLDELRNFKDVHEGWGQKSHVSGTPTVDLQDVLVFQESNAESSVRRSPDNDKEGMGHRDEVLADGILPTLMI